MSVASACSGTGVVDFGFGLGCVRCVLRRRVGRVLCVRAAQRRV